ncbi:MAG: cytochrome-c peroxidase [Elusimicrobiota bacterium]
MIAFLLIALLSLPAAADDSSPADPEAALWRITKVTTFRRDDRASAAQLELGRRLFFDPGLSINGAMSCATCHDPSHYYADGLPRAIGRNGKPVARHTPSLLKAYTYRDLFWDGRASTVDEAALIALRNPEEMAASLTDLSQRLAGDPGYAQAFASAFPGASISSTTIGRALGAFVVSLAAPEDSPFDHFLKDRTGLSPAAKRGLVLYSGKANCYECHASSHLNFASRFRNIGLAAGVPDDPGRYRVEPVPENWGAFRPPSLRNTALTPPYMHDGRFKTLAEVVNFYNGGGNHTRYQSSSIKPLNLSQGEKSDLLAFLDSLTSRVKRDDQRPVKRLMSPPAATAPSTPEADTDGLMAQASEQVRRLEALAKLASAPADLGRPGVVGAKDAAEYCARSPMTVALLPPIERDLLSACQAFASRDPGRCREIPGAFLEGNSTGNCVASLEGMSLLVELAAPGPESLRACAAGYGLASPKLAAEDRGKACAALGSGGDARSRCLAFQAAAPYAFVGIRVEDCAGYLSYLMKGTGCDTFPKESVQSLLCPAFASFRRSRCGSDYLCRALAGDARACDDERAALVASSCRRPARSPGSGAVSNALRRELEDAAGWATSLPLLDQSGRDSLLRLHGMLGGERPLEPKAALADAARLRDSALGEYLYRAENLGAPPERVRELRRRALAALRAIAG